MTSEPVRGVVLGRQVLGKMTLIYICLPFPSPTPQSQLTGTSSYYRFRCHCPLITYLITNYIAEKCLEKPDVYAVHLEMWIGLLYVESRHVIIFLTNSLPHFLTQVQKKRGFGLDRVQSRSSNAKSRTLQIPSKKTETWWEYKLSFKYFW